MLKSFRKELAFPAALIVVVTSVSACRMHSKQISVTLHGIRTLKS